MNPDAKADNPHEGIAGKFCFVQLTRMGDLIQTYRVSSLFKEHNPEAKLYLVARKRFALPLMFLLERCFDEVFLLDIQDMVENVENSDNLISNISAMLDGVSSNDFDELYNLSWSGSSGYVCSLIRAKRKKGLVRNDENRIVLEDKWSQLVYSMIMRGSYCPYNVVDIYKSIVGVGQVAPTSNMSRVTSGKKIVVHPFASNAKKHWKHSKWVEVIYKILKTREDREMVIVGGENDRKTAELILESPVLEKYKDRIFLKIDEMGVRDLLDTLSCAEIFIGHDSFVSHLAALTDVPIVTLAMGTVRTCETAPYSSRAYIVSPRTSCYPCFPDDKCDFYKCHADIPYQVVVGVVDLILDGGGVDTQSLNQNITSFLLSSVNVFKTSFKDSGFLHLEQITESNIHLKDIFMIFYRVTYLCFFEMSEEPVGIPDLDRKTKNELGDAMEGLRHVYGLYEFGKTYSKNILEEIGSETPAVDKIKSYSDNIDEVERLQGLLANRYPVLKPMIDFFTVGRRNMRGENAVEVSESSYYEYHGALIFTAMMYELCEKTIKEYENCSFDNTERV